MRRNLPIEAEPQPRYELLIERAGPLDVGAVLPSGAPVDVGDWVVWLAEVWGGMAEPTVPLAAFDEDEGGEAGARRWASGRAGAAAVTRHLAGALAREAERADAGQGELF